jgi:putative restriction endonuclease
MTLEQSPKYGTLWSRDELILAFDLYCRIPFQRTKATTPEVKELAGLLHRTPASVARKLGNFGAFDPELKRRSISGLAHGSKLDREIWDEFHNDWSRLVVLAHELRRSLQGDAGQGDVPSSPPTGPSERTALVKQRVHQGFFRDAVLSSYGSVCCVTGLNIPQCLIASHIVPWRVNESLRADPTNGLCLSATFDRLFDCGLMTITADLTICMSNHVLLTAIPSVRDAIVCYHERSIHRPTRFMPSVDCLEWHRENIFLSN